VTEIPGTTRDASKQCSTGRAGHSDSSIPRVSATRRIRWNNWESKRRARYLARAALVLGCGESVGRSMRDATGEAPTPRPQCSACSRRPI
jgi:hypothetical protein